jgi:hypothetical protein
MTKFTSNAEEEAEFDNLMEQARSDAWTFGISQRFEAYLDQFQPIERMQHILAMFAELENQVELCQRLLAVELNARDAAEEAGNQSGKLSTKQ